LEKDALYVVLIHCLIVNESPPHGGSTCLVHA
jgi:hypothetical protein